MRSEGADVEYPGTNHFCMAPASPPSCYSPAALLGEQLPQDCDNFSLPAGEAGDRAPPTNVDPKGLSRARGKLLLQLLSS